MNHNEFWNKEPKKIKRGHEALIWMVIIIAITFSLYHVLENLQLIK